MTTTKIMYKITKRKTLMQMTFRPKINMFQVAKHGSFIFFPELSFANLRFSELMQDNLGIMCSLRTPRPICQSTSRLTYRSTVGRHIDRCSTDMSVDISTDSRPMCRSRCVGRHIGRYIGRYLDRHIGRYVD